MTSQPLFQNVLIFRMARVTHVLRSSKLQPCLSKHPRDSEWKKQQTQNEKKRKKKKKKDNRIRNYVLKCNPYL